MKSDKIRRLHQINCEPVITDTFRDKFVFYFFEEPSDILYLVKIVTFDQRRTHETVIVS